MKHVGLPPSPGKARMGIMLCILLCGCRSEQMWDWDCLHNDEALAHEVEVARAGWEREQAALHRIAELRSDDPYRRGVTLEWVGPRWVIGRVSSEAEAYFLRAWAVYLGGTRVSDDDLSLIGTLTHLRELYLHRTDITDRGLVHLRTLRHLRLLHLRNTKVTDAGLEELSALHELRKLYLYETRVTDSGVEALRKALPTAEVHWR